MRGIYGDFPTGYFGIGFETRPCFVPACADFKKDAALLNDFLGNLSSGMRVAFEFRHVSWLDDEIFVLLKNHKAALCIAETSDLATPSIATTDFGYLRLRRRAFGVKTTNRKI